MTARPNTYLEIYGARTPRYDDRPASRVPGAVLALVVAGVALLAVAPEVVTELTDLVVGALTTRSG